MASSLVAAGTNGGEVATTSCFGVLAFDSSCFVVSVLGLLGSLGFLDMIKGPFCPVAGGTSVRSGALLTCIVNWNLLVIRLRPGELDDFADDLDHGIDRRHHVLERRGAIIDHLVGPK